MISGYQERLQELEEEGRLRNLRPLEAREGAYVSCDGQRLFNLSSNDYLGIGGNHALHREFYHGLGEGDLLEQYALGGTSSRLLSGDNHVAHRLEERLAALYKRPACLLFNSGYHANIGILPALTGKGDLILSDKLNHASIHDSLRLCRAAHKRFRHCDYDHLESILARERRKYRKVVLVSESVFSMDGDVADLGRLVAIKEKYDCLLYIDEAHGVGVYGDRGLGKAEECGVIAEVDLLVGTFGKAWASLGAFVVCDESISDYLVNFSRSLIFTTALPPVVLAWNLFLVEKITAMAPEREKLARMSADLRRSLENHGLATAGATNIIPVIIGDNARTVAAAAALMESGYLICAVRPPTVPEGTARFRLSLTAAMDWSELRALPAKIVEVVAAS